MRPTIRLSQAWLDAHGWSLAEGAEFLELNPTDAVPAGAGDTCPQCARSHTEYQSSAFEPDPATATSETERGRVYVQCICGSRYWYAAVDVLSEPAEDARVRAASSRLTPKTGSLQVEGQPVPPPVVEEITVTEQVEVVLAASATGEPTAAPPDPPVRNFLMTQPYRQPWYGRYAREASRIFPPALGLLLGLVALATAALAPSPVYIGQGRPVAVMATTGLSFMGQHTASGFGLTGLPIAGESQINFPIDATSTTTNGATMR